MLVLLSLFSFPLCLFGNIACVSVLFGPELRKWTITTKAVPGRSPGAASWLTAGARLLQGNPYLLGAQWVSHLKQYVLLFGQPSSPLGGIHLFAWCSHVNMRWWVRLQHTAHLGLWNDSFPSSFCFCKQGTSSLGRWQGWGLLLWNISFYYFLNKHSYKCINLHFYHTTLYTLTEVESRSHSHSLSSLTTMLFFDHCLSLRVYSH